MRPTHTEFQPHTFIGDKVFFTKDGGCGAVIRLRPLDSECMEEVDQAATTDTFRTAIRTFGTDCTVYQYLIKRKIERIETSDAARADYLSTKGLYSFDIYLVIVRDGAESLADAAESFCQQVSESLRASVVEKAEAYTLFRRLLNYDETVARSVAIKHDDHVGYFAADSPIEAHRGVLRVGDHWAKVMTLKDPPTTKTKEDLLKPLREMDCECILVTEWRAIALQTARDFIQSKISHFHRVKYVSSFFGSALGKMSGSKQEERPEDMQKDESAAAMEKQLGELLVDIEKNGAQLGKFAMTVILFDQDSGTVAKSAAEVFKAMAKTGTVFYQERHNTLAAWFAALPGGRKHQRRSLYLTDRNYADMSMLFAPDTGTPWVEHLKAECLAVLETRQKTPYYATTHYGDVPHGLFSGQTGSGKSYSANYLLSSAVQRYDPQVVIFDIGGSYKDACSKAGGAYVQVGDDNPFTINPFCLPDTSANRKFLFSFAKVLIESDGYSMTATEKETLYRALRGNKRLSDLAARLPESLQPYIGRWVGDGQFAELFDNEQDTLTFSRFQVFEFEDLEEKDETLEPLLFYILHRMSAGLSESGFKLMLLDEAWRLLENDSIRRYVHRGLKTWRKKNAAMWIATQSMGDLDSTAMLETVAENCGYLVLLPNPRMNEAEYKRVFKLSETECKLVREMKPKAESMWKPAVGPSRVVILDAGVTK